MGAQNVNYQSSEIAGEEKIIAEVEGEKKGEAAIKVRVPGLLELGAGDGYTLIGQTNTHPRNHYGTENTLYSLLDLTGAYYEENKGTLRINDISLPWGGAFDLCGQWDPGKTCTKYSKGGHKTHRVGKTVDVSNMTAEGKVVTKTSLIEIISNRLGIMVIDEGNHFHFTFP